MRKLTSPCVSASRYHQLPELQSNALCNCFDRMNLSLFFTDVTSSTGPLRDVKIRAWYDEWMRPPDPCIYSDSSMKGVISDRTPGTQGSHADLMNVI